ncbi:hypothetical protein N9391_01125 [Gammaproteobacteria bacterium]|nr:hypothetical protein [Gammaproteobacteria bacterium]
MGINTNIYFMFGWEAEITDTYRELMEEKDYENIKGVITTDMDFQTAYVGVVLDESGDLRWDDPCFSNTFCSEDAAHAKLCRLFEEGDTREHMLKSFPCIKEGPPRFGVVQVHS